MLYECLEVCFSIGSAGTDAAGYAVAWSVLGFIGEGLHRNTYIGSYVAGPKRGRRCVVKRLKGEKGAWTGDQMPDFLRQDIGVSDVCICLAGEFNKLQQNNRTRTLRFNKYLALRVGSAGRLSGFAPGEWVTVEDYYPGGFEKLVANSGVVAYENNRGVRWQRLVIGRIIGRKASSWSRIFRVSDQNWRKSIYSRTRRSIRSMSAAGV